MKYLKTFENYSEPQDITQDIADDLLPKVQKMREEKGSLTVYEFEEYMKERGADLHTIDLVMSNLVDMGFDFDVEVDEGDDDVEFDLKNIVY
jgi:hypothetical protein